MSDPDFQLCGCGCGEQVLELKKPHSCIDERHDKSMGTLLFGGVCFREEDEGKWKGICKTCHARNQVEVVCKIVVYLLRVWFIFNLLFISLQMMHNKSDIEEPQCTSSSSVLQLIMLILIFYFDELSLLGYDWCWWKKFREEKGKQVSRCFFKKRHSIFSVVSVNLARKASKVSGK